MVREPLQSQLLCPGIGLIAQEGERRQSAEQCWRRPIGMLYPTAVLKSRLQHVTLHPTPTSGRSVHPFTSTVDAEPCLQSAKTNICSSKSVTRLFNVLPKTLQGTTQRAEPQTCVDDPLRVLELSCTPACKTASTTIAEFTQLQGQELQGG